MQNDAISREAAMRQFTAEPQETYTLGQIVAALDALPAVDTVEVVRCRECKYCEAVDAQEAWCYGGKPAVLTRMLEDYCSHGKRREEEHNAAD